MPAVSPRIRPACYCTCDTCCHCRPDDVTTAHRNCCGYLAMVTFEDTAASAADPYGTSLMYGSHYGSPEPYQFHGSDSRAHYGMEIEVTTEQVNGAILTALDEGAGHDILFFKPDGSVEGFEAVTHPMTYAWAIDHFPWEILARWKSENRCTIVRESNGIHVHVSRAAFDGPSHVFKWMKLFYLNQPVIERLAGRRDTSWAEFRREVRDSQITHVKRKQVEAKGVTSSNVSPWYLPPGWRDRTTSSRYQAINCTNDDTFEVRVFASTLRPSTARRHLQVVAGTVEYTRQLTAHDVAACDGWSWPAFAQWISANSHIYPELAEWNDTYFRPGDESRIHVRRKAVDTRSFTSRRWWELSEQIDIERHTAMACRQRQAYVNGEAESSSSELYDAWISGGRYELSVQLRSFNARYGYQHETDMPAFIRAAQSELYA
jgi:hypothetical protein